MQETKAKTKLKRRGGNRGVALLMVLAGLALLSGLVVEFAYNSNVTFNLALNERDRLQAYYLAESGLQFSKLVIRYDKEAKSVAAKASDKLGKPIQIQPLYEMIPLSTQMLRSLSGMGLEGMMGGEGGGVEPPTTIGEEPEAGTPSEVEAGLQEINLKGAESFLAFEGDFSAEITEEDAKINLNSFYSLSPRKKSYDRLKNVLYHLLADQEFVDLFEDRYRDAKALAQNIADYIDKDESYNEPGGLERGREGASGGLSAAGTEQMKNGKLLSLEELILVPGMTDPIFQKLKEYVTVYGTDEKVNLCRAKEPLVRAMVIAYTENNPKMEPIGHDNEELLVKATEAVLNNCPDVGNMSRELDLVLGVAPEDLEKKPTTTTTSSGSAQGRTSSGSEQQEQQDNSAGQFGELIKDKADIFTIVSTGNLGESEVKVKLVLDTSNSNPRQWKELYWRVE